MEIPMTEVRTTGVEVNYLIVCKRKLWFYIHGIAMEQNSSRVEVGKEVHDTRLEGKKTELLIDDTIRLDYIDKELAIHELKMSKSMDEASKCQILYYIYYLRNKGVDCKKGIIHYPESKRTEDIQYDDSSEEKIKEIIEQINTVKQMKVPPQAEKERKCKKCSYYELCFC